MSYLLHHRATRTINSTVIWHRWFTAGWQEGHPAHNNLWHLSPKVPVLKWERVKEENHTTQVHVEPGKQPLEQTPLENALKSETSDKKWMNGSRRQFLPASRTLSGSDNVAEDSLYALFTKHVAACSRHHLSSSGFHFTERIQTNWTVCTWWSTFAAAVALTAVGRPRCSWLCSNLEGDGRKVIVGQTTVTDNIWSQQVVNICRRRSPGSRCVWDNYRAAIKVCQIDKLLVIVVYVECQINHLRHTVATGNRRCTGNRLLTSATRGSPSQTTSPWQHPCNKNNCNTIWHINKLQLCIVL